MDAFSGTQYSRFFLCDLDTCANFIKQITSVELKNRNYRGYLLVGGKIESKNLEPPDMPIVGVFAEESIDPTPFIISLAASIPVSLFSHRDLPKKLGTAQISLTSLVVYDMFF